MTDPTDPSQTRPPSEAESASNGDARIGTVVDKYTIAKLLGRGGMGAVYQARHARLARRVAIKFLLPQFAEHPDVLRRFENEAQAAGSLEHPNVAAVTDLGRAPDGSPYLVMEFLEGQDCAALLARRGPLPAERVADIVIQACRGLAAAHRAGIVHRDLKPENLFVTEAGDGSDWVKVLDFGIAKLRSTDASVLTGTGVTMGTAYYMSPEQARGAAQVDERTDVWSLGVVLYELLTQKKPFQGDQFLHIIHQILSAEPTPLSSLGPSLDPGLVAVVNRAMDKNLDARWASVEELARALLPYAGTPRATLRDPEERISSFAETQPSPVTTVEGVAIGDSSAGVPAASGPPGNLLAVRPAGRMKNLLLTLTVLLTGTVAVAIFTWPWPSRMAIEDAATTQGTLPVTGAGSEGMELQPAIGPTAPPPTASAAAASSLVSDAAPSIAPTTPVRTLFERPAPSSNKGPKRERPDPGKAPQPSAPSTSEVPARKPAIDIVSDNPYAP